MERNKKRKNFLGVLAALLLALLIAAPLAMAQSTGGRIRGTVMDPSGGSVAAAKIVLTNEATGATRDAQSGADGEYMFLEVPVGTYRLDVQMAGFKKYTRKDVILQLNQVLQVDVTLQVGGATETVEVTGAPPLVDTTSTQLGAVVNERSVVQLPLAQRDTYQLLSLQPGVQSTLGVDNVFGSDKAGVVAVNGGRGRDNNFTVNGGDGNDQFANLPAVQPSPDAIAEFRVLTNTFDAEYGRNSGAVINVVTKSGTNEWHGNVYDYFRNKNLNARGFFDFEKLDYVQNQFGATFGGPIKKDKTFFFATYEGDRIRQGVSSDTVTVPTAAERLGDFSAGPAFAGTLTNSWILTSRQGCQNAVDAMHGGPGSFPITDGMQYAGTYDPVTGALIAPGIFTNTTGAVPVDNQIPTECMDPTARDLMTLVPQANTAAGYWQGGPLKHERSNQFTLKANHSLSKNQDLETYYYFTQHYLAKPFARFQAGGANLSGFGDLTDERTQQLVVKHSWRIGSSAVNEIKFTFLREGQGTYLHPQNTSLVGNSCPQVVANNCFTDPSQTNNDNNNYLGVYPNLGAAHEGLPFINISGGFSMGNNFEGELPQKGNTFQFTEGYSKELGKHSLKFGGDFRIQQFDQRLYFDINGAFYIYGGGPNDPMYANNLFPNFLLGLNDNYIQGSAQDELVRSKSLYLFAQDSWKLTSNLTLNYGLRWEMNTPLTDKGMKVQTFHPGQNTAVYPCKLNTTNPYYDPLQADGGCANAGFAPTGVVVPGDTGVPSGLSYPYYKSFAPRIGLAWSPSGGIFGVKGKTSVRAGFGIFYNPIEQLVLEQFSAEPPFGGSTSIYNTMLSLPFLYQDPTQGSAPNPFNGILNPARGSKVDWSVFRPMLFYGQWPAHMRSQYAEQYNLSIQREIVKNLVFQISYVGRQGHRLLATKDLNPGNAQTCIDLANLGQGCNVWSEDNPYSFVLPEGATFHLPYVGGGGGASGPNTPCSYINPSPQCVITGGVGGTQIDLVGIRPYSSPNCNPLTNTGCPVDGIPVITSIFTQDTMASSSYNSLQASLEKQFSHGVQFSASYTFGKSMDYASTFESLVDPYNMKRNHGLSLFDARHRFVFSYVWDLPTPKMQGFAGKIVDGWEVSGITQYQTGFPVRITSQDDMELQGSFDFEMPGQPNFSPGATFAAINPKNTVCAFGTGPNAGINSTGQPCQPINAGFDPNVFTNATVNLGSIGNAPRTICCGPTAFNTDFGFLKTIPVNERVRFEFHGQFLNVFNHTQFMQPDGNITDGTDFGRIKRARDPRLVQFALKLFF